MRPVTATTPFSGLRPRWRTSSVEDVGEGLVPASLASPAVGIPAILMALVLVVPPSACVAVMIIIVVVAMVTAVPFEVVLLLDGASDEPLQFATVEPDTSALLTAVDRHAVAHTFIEH